MESWLKVECNMAQNIKWMRAQVSQYFLCDLGNWLQIFGESMKTKHPEYFTVILCQIQEPERLLAVSHNKRTAIQPLKKTQVTPPCDPHRERQNKDVDHEASQTHPGTSRNCRAQPWRPLLETLTYHNWHQDDLQIIIWISWIKHQQDPKIWFLNPPECHQSIHHTLGCIVCGTWVGFHWTSCRGPPSAEATKAVCDTANHVWCDFVSSLGDMFLGFISANHRNNVPTRKQPATMQQHIPAQNKHPLVSNQFWVKGQA